MQIIRRRRVTLVREIENYFSANVVVGESDVNSESSSI